MEYTKVEDIPGIVAGLHKTYKSGVTRPLEWRRLQLKALRCMVNENEDALLGAMKEDLHRGAYDSLVLELWDVVGQVGFLLSNLEKLSKTDKLKTPLTLKPLNYEAWKEPYGVVTLISPWNFPVGLLLNPLAGALAAGNACVVKPSEISAATGRLFAELIPKYFKPTEVAIVSGAVEQTTELLAQKVDYIMYTGGTKVGKIVMAAAAKNLTPVTLELGGKCPVYVDESANLEVSARRIVYYKNINAGQICIDPDFVMVHHKVRDAFLEHLQKEHKRLHPGNEQEDENICRIVNAAHFSRVKGLLEGHGGKVVFGGEMDEEDKFLAFTVILDPSPDSQLMQEEIFGPILPVLTVQSVEEAIAFNTDRPTPLGAYVFERDPAVANKWLTEVASGGACTNDCLIQLANNEGGLGGKGESGMGVTRGKASFNTFTHRKIVARQSPNFDILAKYPPYNGIPWFMKMVVSQDFPSWMKLAYWGVIGAVTAGLALQVSKHISITISVY